MKREQYFKFSTVRETNPIQSTAALLGRRDGRTKYVAYSLNEIKLLLYFTEVCIIIYFMSYKLLCYISGDSHAVRVH